VPSRSTEDGGFLRTIIVLSAERQYNGFLSDMNGHFGYSFNCLHFFVIFASHQQPNSAMQGIWLLRANKSGLECISIVSGAFLVC
jgi:hypothetical protein